MNQPQSILHINIRMSFSCHTFLIENLEIPRFPLLPVNHFELIVAAKHDNISRKKVNDI